MSSIVRTLKRAKNRPLPKERNREQREHLLEIVKSMIEQDKLKPKPALYACGEDVQFVTDSEKEEVE